MPCYNPDTPRQPTMDYGKDSEVDDLKNDIILKDAALCAICNELERRGILLGVFEEGQKHSKMNLWNFWEEHKKQDRIRLKSSIKKNYSLDELAIIREILNETTDG